MASDAALLARIDERTKKIQEDLTKLEKTVQRQYVSQAEFKPVKLVVYGIVATMGTAVVVSLLTLVIVA